MRDKVKNKVIVQSSVQVNNDFWYIAGNTNGLFKKNLSNGQIEFMGFFPEESKLGFRLYSHVIYYDGKLIFAPCYAETIAIYHLIEKKITNIPFESDVKANKYLKLIQYKNNIYFVPYLASDFIKFDINKEEKRILDGWEELRKRLVESFVVVEVCIYNNHMYMFTNPTRQVIILDMDTDQFQVEKLAVPEDECVHSVCKGNNGIWIVTNKSKIYQWDYINKELNMIVNLEGCCEYYTSDICATKQYLYLINNSEKDIGRYDLLNDEFSIMRMNDYIRDKTDDCVSLYYYYDIHCTNDKLYIQSFYDGKYIKIDGNKVVDTSEKIYIPEEYWENFRNETISENDLYLLGMSLPEWVCHSWKPDKSEEERNIQQSNVGKKIYDEVVGDNL